ncbi:hypothetical protein BASA81_005191 [Batrachochytrium salamandrivorans]|nr:hypothetical protein BASA81_005191 [Batrachochytrium salamandrivorans]
MSAEPPSSFSERDNVRTGYAGNLTPQQQSCFDELMAKASASEYAGDLNLMSHPDWYVLRFLRATMLDKTGKRVVSAPGGRAAPVCHAAMAQGKEHAQIRDNIRNSACRTPT